VSFSWERKQETDAKSLKKKMRRDPEKMKEGIKKSRNGVVNFLGQGFYTFALEKDAEA